MRIVLVRHARTAANEARRWQGQTDAPLTEAGLAQARALGRRLRGVRFDVVVASDLGRTVATAEALGVAAAQGPPIAGDPAWRECDVGAWEGLTHAEVADRYPEQLRALVEGRTDVPLGGAETLEAFWRRVDAALDALAARLGERGVALVVTHGGVIAAVVARLLGRRGERRSVGLGRIANTGLTVLARGEGGALGLARLNDHLHLAPDQVGADDRAGGAADGGPAPLIALHAARSPADLAGALARHAAWWRPPSALFGEDDALLDAARDALGPKVALLPLPADDAAVAHALFDREEPAALAAAPARARALALRVARVPAAHAAGLLEPPAGAVSHVVRGRPALSLVDHAAALPASADPLLAAV
jgi:probable phosphoglycerate mutase